MDQIWFELHLLGSLGLAHVCIDLISVQANCGFTFDKLNESVLEI